MDKQLLYKWLHNTYIKHLFYLFAQVNYQHVKSQAAMKGNREMGLRVKLI